jgi:hypothetical protein
MFNLHAHISQMAIDDKQTNIQAQNKINNLLHIPQRPLGGQLDYIKK